MSRVQRRIIMASLVTPFVYFNGTTTEINAGSEASLDDLPAAAWTGEGWFRADSSGENNLGTLWNKGTQCQLLYNSSATNMIAQITASTSGTTVTLAVPPTGVWRHLAVTYNDAGDKKVRYFVNGALYASGTAAVGTYVSDAANILRIGYSSGAGRHYHGGIGWLRWSNVVRYSAAFIPPSRLVYPVVDANTMRLFKMNEGAGTTIIDYSANAQNATLANGTWMK